jgi:glycosyltransferase involved in cell wall biosynthesis
MAEITIGLPVRNGGESLARALDQMRAQTYTNFRLVISDNASTDDTRRICEEYAERDARIIYRRRDILIPGSENYRSLVMDATTPFFMWISHDDIWFPTFIEKCLTLIRSQPGVVCVVPRSNIIEKGGRRKIYKGTAPLHGTPAQRMRLFLSKVYFNHRYYGIFRTEALQRSFPIPDWYFAYDWLVVALSTLEGAHDEVPEILFEKFANPRYHYFRAHSFETRSPMERFLPCLRFTRELRARVPVQVWHACLPELVAINIEFMSQRLESFHTWLRGPLSLMRVATKIVRNRAALSPVQHTSATIE